MDLRMTHNPTLNLVKSGFCFSHWLKAVRIVYATLSFISLLWNLYVASI